VKLLEQVFKQRAIQVIEVGPGYLASSNFGHGGSVSVPPFIGEARAQSTVMPLAFPMPCFFDNGSPAIGPTCRRHRRRVPSRKTNPARAESKQPPIPADFMSCLRVMAN